MRFIARNAKKFVALHRVNCFYEKKTLQEFCGDRAGNACELIRDGAYLGQWKASQPPFKRLLDLGY